MSVDQLVAAIRAWAAESLPGLELTLRAPDAGQEGEGVFVSFVGYRAANDSRNTSPRRDPVIDILEVDLLITFAVADALEQARLAADFHFAALQGNAPFLLVGPQSNELLRELGAVPGKSVLVRSRLARERDARAVPPVREAVFDVVDRGRVADPLREPALREPRLREPIDSG